VSRSPLRLDIILPTHNRQHLLARALDSVLAAEVPSGLTVRITVVDNNCTDATRELVRARAADFGGRLTYLFEPHAGKPFALNTGIAATSGDLIGLIDDDEEIDRGWYQCIEKAFRDESLDFNWGRCLPRWGGERPEWLGKHNRGVIGWVENGLEPLEFGPSFPGILTGGNAVITRAMMRKVGPYSTALSRTPTRLMGAEDEHLYYRLLRIGAHGRYLPELVIYHYVPAERLTKRYFRRWCFWCGVSRGLIDVEYPAPVPYLAGVPRYMFGKAVRDGVRALQSTVTGRVLPEERFAGELNIWDLAGFIYGKHFYGATRRQRPQRLIHPDIRCEGGGA
jgi:glycosyltransferase involved in cell wall biosynthesis